MSGGDETNPELPVAKLVRERRTIREFNGIPLDKSTVVELLEDASWAPFHSRKEPWRFVLFLGDGRRTFADAMIATLSKEMKQEWGDWFREQFCRKIAAHLLVVIKADPRQTVYEEAFAAASACIQNLQLLAWERGIGIVWKTNEYNWNPKFHRAVGVMPEERIVGTLHMGYFDRMPRAKRRTPVTELLTCHEHARDELPYLADSSASEDNEDGED